ncbi:MAG: SLC13 family permease [Fidelibacterota bacterium]
MIAPRSPGRRPVALATGPLLFLLFILLLDLDPANRQITTMAAVAVWMAAWWITEVIPLGMTALLPVVVFPLTGIMSGKEVAPVYVNDIIFLFVGGFMIALAMKRWNLHKRIALAILARTGKSPPLIVLGFMAATWFLSMWISNTATTMMMVPIALAIIMKLEESLDRKTLSRFSVGLLLAVAYSSSIGGIATLVGTPPNLAFVKIFATHFPEAPEISFSQWFAFALPPSVVFLAVVWGFVTLRFFRRTPFRVTTGVFRNEYEKMGPMTFEEKIVLADFVLLALLWLTRSDLAIGSVVIRGWSSLLMVPEFVDDGTVAIAMAVILFLIPSKKDPSTTVLNWKTAVQLPWNIVLLFGGGFALAAGFVRTGLSGWLGNQLEVASVLTPFFIVVLACTLVTFLTELTSNTATAQVILPIIASLAIAIHVNPLLLMLPVTLSASCAFMLPVATPPNAIVFGTQRLKVADMARAGLFVNLTGVVIIPLAVFTLALPLFGIDLGSLPAWAQ